jgi:hypothetical protein
MIKRIRELLNEISVLDIYPKQFKAFIEKYKSQIGDESLFVNFSSYKTDPLDKRFGSSQGLHHDPDGLYVYPLEYVVNHPADLNFGENRENLVVVRSKAQRVLDLQSVTPEQATSDLKKLELSYIPTNEKPGKTLYVNARWKNDHLLSGKEQADRFKQLGYDFILDTAKTSKDAIIHGNEPEQGVFLTRNAFEVVETFKLREKKIDNWSGSASDYLKAFGRKIGGLFAQKLKTGITQTNPDGWAGYTIYLRNGIRIELILSKNTVANNVHRQSTEYLPFNMTVSMHGEAFYTKSFKSYERLENIIDTCIQGYNDKIKKEISSELRLIKKKYPNLVKIAEALGFKKDISLRKLEGAEVLKAKKYMRKIIYAISENESYRIPALETEFYGKNEPPEQVRNLVDLYSIIYNLKTEASEEYLARTTFPPDEKFTNILLDSLM